MARTKDHQATAELIALVSKAKSTIDIENPYFIPTFRWRRAFKKSIERGVKTPIAYRFKLFKRLAAGTSSVPKPSRQSIANGDKYGNIGESKCSIPRPW